MKKVLLSLGAVAAVAIALPMFSAFEAHVINVIAQIENALQVNATEIDFGTVFPQEHLEKPLLVSLSRSFMTETDADDVDYFIRQKPKCGVTKDNGTVLVGPTATGHVNVNPLTGEVTIDCGKDPRPVIDQIPQPPGSSWGVLPSLCEYISKEPGEGDNDGSTNSFHKPWEVLPGTATSTPQETDYYLVWNDTPGRLAKSDQNTEDNWTIDLAVPCFGDFCAQDWLNFVRHWSDNSDMTQEEADSYTQPIVNEHKIFGCDLWVEVSGVSRYNTECTDGIDNDGDQTIDYPQDPGCSGPTDNNETNVIEVG